MIDLSARLGFASTEYSLACKYIEKIFKKYKNKCVFVFAYNSDNPGFAYKLLGNLSKHMLPVKLKEGSGDKQSALRYLKSLIKNSKYSQYANQANEFMKTCRENEFTQTDVLEKFEEFCTWCINKNILNSAYDFEDNGDFQLDRTDNHDASYNQLCGLVGLDEVKRQIDRIICCNAVEKERKNRVGKSYASASMHMIFSGNPGTAKTTVGKLFAGIAKERGIINSSAFVYACGNELNLSTNIYECFESAKGGVLFIDEAYAVVNPQAITLLLQQMEEKRGEVIVILAGYKNAMDEFLERNEGLKSRIPYRVNFPDYSVHELSEIFVKTAGERGFKLEEKAVLKARNIFEKACKIDNFGNGRYVRNVVENAIQNQSVRLLSKNKSAENIRKRDLFINKRM